MQDAAGIGRDLAAIHGDDVQPDQASLRAQAEDRAEHAPQGVLMALDETRDRRVIGLLLGGDHAVGDVLDALALDPSR